MAIDKHLQLLRNGSMASSRTDAISVVTNKLKGNNKVGEPALGIYEVDSKKYAVLGIYVGNNEVQIIEGLEATQADIATALASAKAYTDEKIASLDVIDSAVAGSYVSAVSEADGKISVTRAELPTVSEIKSDGQAIIAVKEDKGVISATAGDIAAAHVTIADTNDHFTATTVEAALDELYSQAGAGSKVTLESSVGEGDVLKVYTIKQGGTEVGTINIPKDLVVKSGSVVKGTWDGNTFTEGTGNGTALKLVIANQTAPVYINTLDLVKDHTAGNGIAISDTNVVSIKLDASNESFLSVGEGGLKLSGVADHVTSKINDLNADVSSTGANGFVTVQVVESSGKVSSVKVTETDIASAALLGTTADTVDANTAFGKIAKEVADRTAAIAAMDANLSGNSAHVTVNVVEDDGKLTAVNVSESDIASASALTAEIEARKAVDGQNGNAYAANTSANYINAATSLNDADVKLDAQVKKNADAITAETSARTAADTALDTRLKEAEKLLGISTGETTGTVESVDSKIAKAISGLDATVVSAEEAKAVVTVVETDGKLTSVSVEDKDIASAKLLGTSSDTSDKDTAFGKIKANAEAITAEANRAKEAEKKNADAITVLNGTSGTTGSVANSIQTAINALDVNAIGGTGKVITTVSEAKGKISATAIDLTAGNVKATASIGDDAHVAVEGDTVAAQIESLAKSIKTTVADAKSYSVAAVSGTELTALGANVKEAFKLVDEDGTQAGETIKIYKDSSLKEVALNGQTLNFTYILADGSESIVPVDVSAFLAESEFKDGLEVVDHVVKVKKDATSEGFLTVGTAGVKLSGVQDAINKAANKAATEVVEDAAGHVTVTKSKGTNGQAIYTIGENDIASDAALTAEANRAKAAEDAIETAVGLNADGSHAKTTGNYTSGATTIAGEISALDAQVKVNTDAIAKEVTDRTNADNAIKASIGESTDATSASTVYGKINANAAAIATLNGNGDGSVAKAIASLKTTLLGGASESADTLGELETAINSVKDAAIKVAAGNGIEITETGTTKTIAVKADNKSIKVDSEGVKVNLVSDGPIVLDGANGLTLGTWDLGNY